MIKWNEYTWYSKLSALVLFILILPILTFYIGRKYEQTTEVLNSVNSDTSGYSNGPQANSGQGPVIYHNSQTLSPNVSETNNPNAPRISKLNPSKGPSATVMVISGMNFDRDQTNNIIFGNNGQVFATVRSSDTTTLLFTIPDSMPGMSSIDIPAGTYNVTVRNSNGTSNSMPFTLTEN